MSRHLFLFVSVAFLVAATMIYGGVRPGEIERLIHSEYKADITSLRDDVRIVCQQSGSLRSDLWSLWLGARSNVILLRADAHFEARRLARPFTADGQF